MKSFRRGIDSQANGSIGRRAPKHLLVASVAAILVACGSGEEVPSDPSIVDSGADGVATDAIGETPADTTPADTTPTLGDAPGPDTSGQDAGPDAAGATDADATDTANVIDTAVEEAAVDAPPPVVSLAPAGLNVTEGNSASTNATFTVTLSAPSAQPVTVQYATANGTATAGSDYAGATGTVTFPAGSTSQTINVPVTGDTVDEDDETFTVRLSSPSLATLGTAVVSTATIVDDDAPPALSIGDVLKLEGNSGQQTFTFTVTLSAASSRPVTVDYSSRPRGQNQATEGGATFAPGNDYRAATGTLTFAPGETTKTIDVVVYGDTTTGEGDETFSIDLRSAQNASINDDSGIGLIVDDDITSPTLRIVDASVTEGDSGTKPMTFPVILVRPAGTAGAGAVTVNYATSAVGGTATTTGTTATGGADYAATNGTVTFAAPATAPTAATLETQTFTVPINGDVVSEADETFFVGLSGETGGAMVSRRFGVGTIVNDDPGPTISIASPAAITEGQGGRTPLSFVVTLSGASAAPINVDFATRDATATAGGSPDGDYLARNGTITFAPGETTKTIDVGINGDLRDEPNETFHVDLSNAVGATIGTAAATGTITDDDATPTLSVAGPNPQLEGAAGSTGTAAFVVTLSAASNQPVTVGFATADGTATAGGDYAAQSGTVTFAPGETTRVVNVTYNGDNAEEPNESFSLGLANAQGATIGTASSTATILNDDSTQPTLSVDDVAIDEGGTGTRTATFTVTLRRPSGQTGAVTVSYVTENGTATAGNDYVANGGTLNFASSGNAAQTQQVTVVINGDQTLEANETFSVVLSGATGASVAKDRGIGTIRNDDSASVAIENASRVEGAAGSTASLDLVVRLASASEVPVTVSYGTVDGSARSGDDFTPTSGTITFAPGETLKSVAVPVIGDGLDENDETFRVRLATATPSGAVTFNRQEAFATIIDDDALPQLAITPVVSADEGNAGLKGFTFTVTLSAASGRTVSVDYTTQNGTATVGNNDYLGAFGTLDFAPGQTSKTITVFVVGDTTREVPSSALNYETFLVALSNETNATVGTRNGEGRIVNDD